MIKKNKNTKVFFILVENGKIKSESASCLHKYARTAIGIKNNKVYLFIATKDSPLDLKELAQIAIIILLKIASRKVFAALGGRLLKVALKLVITQLFSAAVYQIQ